MVFKKMILIILAYFLINSCRINNVYKLYTRFDESDRKSTLFLSKNDVIIDSIKNIGSYYGKDSIVKKNENRWDYFYHGRCGTGCSIIYYMNVSPVNDKINVKLNILYQLKESDSNHQNISTQEYLLHFSSEKNDISKITKNNGILKNEISSQIIYDKEYDIYYNEILEYNNSSYKGIKVDSIEYILIDKNNWKFFDSKSGKINELQ